ncbi:hypothetical protein [Streptomyces sp. NRRL F-5755]|uniref:hypothetical protein n=1 Tax=Streptomyces sp. NRRL F-5755 TaxID=1519475 RepID=UPI000ADF51C7
MIIDARGTSLAITLTAGNRHDVIHSLPLLDAIPHLKGRTGSPRQRLRQVFADRGCEFDEYCRLRWRCGIKVIARRGVPHGSKPGTVRCVVERTNAGSAARPLQRGLRRNGAAPSDGGPRRPGAYGQCSG